MSEQTQARKGMMVTTRRSQPNESSAHHRNMLIYVSDVIEDPDYGMGVIGFSMLTRQPYIIFSNPNPDESRLAARKVNTMNDWVNGIKIGQKFTVNKGAIIHVNNLTFRRDFLKKRINNKNEPKDIPVLFCQWIRLYKSMEQAKDPEFKKEIFTAYAIGAEYTTASNQKRARFWAFFPIGKGNKFNDGDQLYPVIFSFKKVDDLIKHINDEHEKYKKFKFTNYVARVVDNKTNKIVGAGNIISCHNVVNDIETTPGEAFAMRLSRLLNVTRSGLESFLAMDGYTFQIYGLIDMPCSFIDGEETGRKSLSDRVLDTPAFIPRNEAGEHCEFLAVPAAFRASYNENTETFWVDRAEVIGHSGRQQDGTYSDKSEFIPADAYSGTPQGENGEILERGLDRADVIFLDEQQNEIAATTMRQLAALNGCKSLGDMRNREREYFMSQWDDMPSGTKISGTVISGSENGMDFEEAVVPPRHTQQPAQQSVQQTPKPQSKAPVQAAVIEDDYGSPFENEDDEPVNNNASENDSIDLDDVPF